MRMQRHVPCEPQQYLRNGGTLEKLAELFDIEARFHPIMPGLVQLKYGKIHSDFSSTIVRQCRGLILDRHDNWNIVARPFDKFFNHGESYAAHIDWRTAQVQEKLDGSLMILYYYQGMWNVATSGTPNAGGTVQGFQMTFARLFWQTWYANKMPLPGELHKNHTFMFELTSPYNRVVVKHDKPRLRLIGVRNNINGAELPTHGFADYEIVRSFPIAGAGYAALKESFDDMDPCEQEGYIVVDADFNRVKVKHPGYVALHHMRSSISPKNVLEVVRQGEAAEVLAHFPEWKQIFDVVQGRYDGLLMELEQDWASMPRNFNARKEFADVAMTSRVPGAMFSMLDGRVKSVREFLAMMHIDTLADRLGIQGVMEEVA